MSNAKITAIITKITKEDTTAYNANYSVHREGISKNEMLHGYSKWGENYEKDLSADRYKGPQYAADYVARYYGKDKLDVRIIDVAAGTGFVGQKLQEAGFTNIDALEPAEGMVEVAKKKKIYNRFVRELLSDRGSTEIEDDTYDCLVISGGMGEGHIPCCALNEMIRIVKPGGIICIVMREEYLNYVEEYKNKLEPLISKLESDGIWQKISRDIVPNYSFTNNGVVFMCKVL